MKERLEIALRQAAQGDSASKVLAQKLMMELGAQSYVLVVARVQYRHALAALKHARCDSVAREPLVDLLNQILPAISRIG
jgi:hypothetical protein